jgi:hypothetical protein
MNHPKDWKTRRKPNMKDVKKDLQMVAKEFKALRKKMGQLTTKVGKTAVDEMEYAQSRVKLKSPAKHAADALKMLARETDKLIKAVDKFEKEKTAKRKRAKTKAKGKPKRKAPRKKPAVKKTRAVTDTDRVLNLVGRSKAGVKVKTLIKKTEFDDKKVRNILNRALKQGKIKRVSRGVYVRA